MKTPGITGQELTEDPGARVQDLTYAGYAGVFNIRLPVVLGSGAE